MMHIRPLLTVRRLSVALATACVLTSGITASRPAVAQSTGPAVQGREGYDYFAKAYATGEERKAQADLWVFELNYKSLRMMELNVTDPKTGETSKELVYYLVYHAINRQIDRKEDDTDTVPVNQYDTDPVPDLFVPRISLITTDSDSRQTINDSIIPEAQAAIERRERRRLQNPVQVVQKLPAAVPEDDTEAEGIHGVALFRGIDPETDYFSIFLSGFSNGYKLVKGPVAYDDLRTLARDGELAVSDQVWNGDLDAEWRAAASVGDLFDAMKSPPDGADTTQWYYTVPPDRSSDPGVTIWRKTLIQKYWRPGDRFDQNEREVRTQGPPRWIYRPDDVVDPAAPAAAPTETAASRPAVQRRVASSDR